MNYKSVQMWFGCTRATNSWPSVPAKPPCRHVPSFHMKRELNQNLSGNEVYYTNSLISIVKNMLSNKLHRQKGSNVIPFSYQIGEYIRPANRGVCCQRGVGRRGVSSDGNSSGPVDPAAQALYGRFELTVRRHEFNEDFLSCRGTSLIRNSPPPRTTIGP